MTTVAGIAIGCTINGGPFQDALGVIGNGSILRGNNVVVGKNQVYVIQAKSHKIRPASGYHATCSHTAVAGLACSKRPMCVLCVLPFTSSCHVFSVVMWHIHDWFGRDGSDSKFQASPSDSAISVPRHQRGERLNCNCPLPSVTSSAMPASFFARPRM